VCIGHFPNQAWKVDEMGKKTFGQWKRVGSVSLSGQHMFMSPQNPNL